MHFEFGTVSFILLGIALLLVPVAWKTWHQRTGHPAAIWCFWLVIASLLWVCGDFFSDAATTPGLKLFFCDIDYIAIPVIPAFYLLFIVSFTGTFMRHLPRLIVPLLAISLAFTVIFWTNPWHGLFWTEFTVTPDNGCRIGYGPLWVAMMVWLYLLLALGLGINAVAAITNRGRFRTQAIVILFSAIAVCCGNLLWISGRNPLPGFDVTPVAFGLMAILFSWSIPKRDFLSLQPLARDRVVELMPDGLIVLDARGRLLDFNPAAAAMTGLEANRIGLPAGTALERWPDLLAIIGPAPASGATDYREVSLTRDDGIPVDLALKIAPYGPLTHDRSGRIVLLHDITDRKRIESDLKRSHNELEILAATDGLTGALNRRTGLVILERQLLLSARRKNSFVLAFVDVNGLKRINDSLGHAAGDSLIVAVATSLQQAIRASDTLVRFGGDEFLVLLPDCETENAELIMQRAEKMSARISNEQALPFEISFSYGLALSGPADQQTADELIGIADAAMYRQKTAHHRERDV